MHLPDDVEAAKPGQAVVPDGGQQLLDRRVGHKLLLVRLDGKLKTVQGLYLAWNKVFKCAERYKMLKCYAWNPGRPVRIVVEQDFQLVAGPGVVDEARGQLLGLLTELAKVVLELGFHHAQVLQLAAQLKRCNQRCYLVAI